MKEQSGENKPKHPINSRHDDVIKWKHFPRNWSFVRGIHRSPVNSPHKGQWRGALMFYLICVWINDWVNNGEAGDLRRYRIHYDVTVMISFFPNWDLAINMYNSDFPKSVIIFKNKNRLSFYLFIFIILGSKII